MNDNTTILDGPDLSRLAETIVVLTGCAERDAWRAGQRARRAKPFCILCGIMRGTIDGYKAAAETLAWESGNAD